MLKNRSIWTWMSLGAVVALVGAGLLAATSDAITSQGNTAQSGTYSPPVEGVDIQGAIVGSPNDCNETTPESSFSDGPLPAVVTGTFDLDADAPSITSQTVCLRNVGTEPGDAIAADFVNASSVEVGPCEQSEVDAGDTTCADGEQGELFVGWGAETSTRCPIDGTFRFTIPAGGYCDYTYDAVPAFVDANGDPTADPTLAQTDAVTYDLVWQIDQQVCEDTGADSQGLAQTLALADTANTTACDDDWYVIPDAELTDGASYTASLLFANADGDLDLYVIDAVGVIAQGTSTSDDEIVEFIAPAGDVYYQVKLFDGGPVSYQLSTSAAGA